MLFTVIGLLAAGYGIGQLVLNLSARGPMVHFAAGAATLGSATPNLAGLSEEPGRARGVLA